MFNLHCLLDCHYSYLYICLSEMSITSESLFDKVHACLLTPKGPNVYTVDKLVLVSVT